MMSNRNQLDELRPNVGFLLREAPGYSRVLQVDLPATTLADAVQVEWLRGQMKLTSTRQGVWVDSELEAAILADCTRCLGTHTLTLAIQLQELFYYPPSSARSLSDYVVTEDGILDLVGPVGEQIILGFPLQILCRPDCRGFCGQCGQNLNLGSCDCEDKATDPRMAVLRELQERLSDE